MLRGIRLLKGVPDDYQGPTINNPWSTTQRGPVEPAGHYFEKLLNKKLNIRETDDETEATSEVEKTPGLTEAEKKKYEQKRKKNNHNLHTEDDPYELLGLGNLRYRATEDDIKAAYKKMSLKYHPDKNRGVVVNEEIFKKINDSYTLLSDKKKRIVFDSEEEFDHTIPTGNEKGDFFEIYGPMFEKFSKWSVTPKVPLLGTPTTPYSQVKDFYDFWFSFKSWRDYSYKDEFNTSDAESREEKRWMERQNERERKKRKQEEFSIIFKLTELAEKLDPRIKQYKEGLKQEKERKKQEKAEAIRKKQEEAERAKQEEADKKKEEERKRNEEIALKKKQKEEETKKIYEVKDKIKELLKPYVPSIDNLENLCTKFNSNNTLFEFVETLEKSANREQYFTETVETLIKEEEEKAKQQREAKIKEKESKKNTGAPWSEEELSLLAQGIAKFPGGTTERWEKISVFIGTRTPKEIIAKTKETSSIKAKPTELVDPFSRFNKTKKKADREITAELSQRDDLGITTTTTTTTATTTTTTPEPVDPSKWTAEEQKLLEKALQTYPASLGDRWDKIAAAIPGKTKKDAIARYKYIVNLVKEKQKSKQ